MHYLSWYSIFYLSILDMLSHYRTCLCAFYNVLSWVHKIQLNSHHVFLVRIHILWVYLRQQATFFFFSNKFYAWFDWVVYLSNSNHYFLSYWPIVKINTNLNESTDIFIFPKSALTSCASLYKYIKFLNITV